MKEYPEHDVTGFKRIQRGAPFKGKDNQQRYVVCAMFNLIVSRGYSREEAAADCKYPLQVIETWNRYFHGIL